MIKYIIIITIIIIIIIIFLYIINKNKFIYLNSLLPFKNINNSNIKKIMIGLPCIDRDSDLLELLYEKLNISINYAIKYYNIEFILAPFMRKTDENCIDFWKSKNADITLMPTYKIYGRHNWDMLVTTFNKILEKARTDNFDGLLLIESDIIINIDTIKLLLDNINKTHLCLAYYEMKWSKYPIILTKSLFPKLKDARDFNKNIEIYGHGVGCLLICKDVINDKKIEFKFDDLFGVMGQDIGFYKSIYDNRYKVLMLNHEVKHLYDRKNNT
jgi:hypothetical protein